MESLTFVFQYQAMSFLKKYIFLLLAFTFVFSCKHKKPSLSGDDPVEVTDFIEFFPPQKLTYTIGDSTLLKKEKDSLLISYKIFRQFVPDTLLSKDFGKTVNPKIYPLGRIDSGEETYLFVKTVFANKRAAYILGFDKKQQYITGMPVLKPDQLVATIRSVSIDKKYSITKTVLRKNGDGSMSEGKDVYVLNADAKNFMLIMTDALDDKLTELINPIDTFPRKNKLSADYGTGKMNLVSIRDGKKNDRLFFFIHFVRKVTKDSFGDSYGEKNNGECTGELKGEARIKSATHAEYIENGDPCKLQFIFTGASVSLKEESCGSHRGLRCLFEGSYPRKKYLKPGSSSKKTIKK